MAGFQEANVPFEHVGKNSENFGKTIMRHPKPAFQSLLFQKTHLNEIELMFTKTSAALIEDRLKETMDILFTKAKKYVEVITVSYDFDYGSPLDKERTQMCLRSMVMSLKAPKCFSAA